VEYKDPIPDPTAVPRIWSKKNERKVKTVSNSKNRKKETEFKRNKREKIEGARRKNEQETKKKEKKENKTKRWSWMSYRMDHPPTVEEIAAEENRLTALAARVKKLEEADAKLRLQELADGLHGGEDKPDMSVEAMMEQMQRKR